MIRSIPERYVWAVDLLDVQPNDAILEIGCGYGHSIRLICEKLENGKFIAIDRSAAMVKAAAQAHADLTRESSAKIIEVDLLHFETELKFDKIFLFNINVIWMDPVEELSVIQKLLRQDGQFYIFHQPPPGHELEEFQRAFEMNMEKYGYQITKIYRNELLRTLCLVSRPG